MKNILDGVNSSLDKVKEKVGEYQDVIIDII